MQKEWKAVEGWVDKACGDDGMDGVMTFLQPLKYISLRKSSRQRQVRTFPSAE